MAVASEQIEIDVDSADQSGTAWAAIIGGALAATAISLILMVLGSGLGLSLVSPWTSTSVTAIATASVVWLIVVQWVASAFGGYLTGRLRTRSSDAVDEVFFRDTANGFLAWALSTLLVAALLTSALSAIIGTGTQVAATVGSSAMQAGVERASVSAIDPTAYFVDTLYRPATTSSAGAVPTNTAATDTASAGPGAQSHAANTSDLRAETERVLVNGIAAKEFPPADLDYLAGLVSTRVGLPPDAAKERVHDIVRKMQAVKAEAQATADQARKNAAKLSIFTFLSLLVGAFIAAAAGALGGGHRDDEPVTVAR